MDTKALIGKEIARRLVDGQTVGVGTGTTVDAALVEIGKRVSAERLSIRVVATSYQTAWRCRELGLQVLDGLSCGDLDWGFDGADALDRALHVIKGRGGAMLGEKIVAAKCHHYLIISDRSKVCEKLPGSVRIPIEVIPGARRLAERGLLALGASDLVLREGTGKHGPTITESGNIILDARFDVIDGALEREIRALLGVVESGLFWDYANEAIIGDSAGIELLLPK